VIEPRPARRACRIAAVALAGALAACGSSQEVRELSERTAANTAALAAAIERMSAQTERLAQRRADGVARLSAASARQAARGALDGALLKRTDDDDALELYEELQEWSTQVREVEAAAAVDEAALARRLLARRTAIESRAQRLRDVAGKLATLAERDTAAERARFLSDYGRAAYATIEANADAVDQAVALGERLLNGIAPPEGGD
jgi:hypothetical protein